MLMIYPEKYYQDAVDFCKMFTCDAVRPRYVLGRNEYATSIARLVDVDGFIDDFSNDTEFLGKPILKMNELPIDSLVVSTVIFVVPVTAINNLKNNGLVCLDYFKFLQYSGLDLIKVEYMRQAKQDIEQNLSNYCELYNCLGDETSKDIFEKLVNFRFSGDLLYLQEFELAPERQYFEDFFDLNFGEVFVDAGGFDGQTVVEFIKRCPDYKSIHIFEPDPLNITLARSNLSKFHNITFHQMGLSDRKNTLKFNSGDGSASKVSETGDIEIKMDSIDNLIEEPVTLIKMDIEGAEEIALQGAKRHIITDYPKLAICCYHKYDDLWKIPEQIKSMRNDYSIYLRHYSEGLHETVMYFMPNS